MIAEFLSLLIQIAQVIWPFRIVRQWERAGYLVFGRWVGEVGPGCWPVLPWFFDVHTVSVVPGIVGTGRQDITVKDGSILSFAATATVRIVDARKAMCDVENVTSTMQELLASVLAEKLADVDASRLEPQSRGRLVADLRRWVQEAAEPFGVEVSSVRFTSFITHAKTHRLLLDQNAVANW